MLTHRPESWRCIACDGPLPDDRWLYCSDACSRASRRLVWVKRHPDREVPKALRD